VKCPHCDREFVPVTAQKYCAFCGGRIEDPTVGDEENRSDLTDRPKAHSRDERNISAAPGFYCPWEEQEQLGLTGGMTRTVTRSLFSPRLFFAMLPRQSGYALPLTYALILETLGGMMSSLWAFVVGNPWLTSAELTQEATFSLAFLIPVVAVVGTFASALVFHGCLIMIGGANEDFQATFRVVCYSSAPELMNAIPVIGPLIAVFWKLSLIFIGLKEVQRATTGTVLTVLLLPALLASALVLAGLALSWAAGSPVD